MISKLKLILNTVRHLKPIQVVYQLKNRFSKPKPLSGYRKGFQMPQKPLSFNPLPMAYQVLKVDGERLTFRFLNQEKTFEKQVDWLEDTHGRLWNYNLQYLDFLRQKDIPEEKRELLVTHLYQWLESGKLRLEPYPVSLRVMNLIRFLYGDTNNKRLLADTFAEVNYLSRRLEYHLLGNHLLENGFSLMMGGAFFGQKDWVSKAEKLLIKELDEQTLNDGGHFELSPMYHQIILFRVLELFDWYSKWEDKNTGFEQFIREKAERMLSWLKQVTFENGDIPHFNDSATGIAYSSRALFDYADGMGLSPRQGLGLRDSGYRKFRFEKYECVVDVAKIGPSYQPGHGHADALSFVLYHKDQPLLVEAGTSTYNECSQRNLERATKSHNTVEINGQNQSQVYSAFRVGNRAKVSIEEEGAAYIKASHDGYLNSLGILHQRHFKFEQGRTEINDILTGKEPEVAMTSFHFYPGVQIKKSANHILIENVGVIRFEGQKEMRLEKYGFSLGFNEITQSDVLRVYFTKNLRTVIELK